MTEISSQLLATTTVTSAASLTAFWGALLRGVTFDRRTLWLVLLDDEGRPAPVVVPIDDLPLLPGVRDFDAVRRLLDGLAGYGTPVLLLSRPGAAKVQDGDRRWVEGLAPLAPAWPLHLATAGCGPASGSCIVQPLSPAEPFAA